MLQFRLKMPLKHYDAAVKRVAQYVNVDGFRKGKAPRAVCRKARWY